MILERMVQRGGGARKSCIALFIDGIAEKVGYHWIRDLFALFGNLKNVFVQRQRKERRRFRFGFVRYAIEEHAIEAIRCLNGLKLGGASMSVSMARSPRSGVANKGKQVDFMHDSSDTEGKIFDHYQLSSSRSWRDVVLGKQATRQSVMFSPGEECIIVDCCRFDMESPKLHDDVLFPEICSPDCWLRVGKALFDGEKGSQSTSSSNLGPISYSSSSGVVSSSLAGDVALGLPISSVHGLGLGAEGDKSFTDTNHHVEGFLGAENGSICCEESLDAENDSGFCVPRRRGCLKNFSSRGRKKKGFAVVIAMDSGSLELLELTSIRDNSLVSLEVKDSFGSHDGE